MKKMTKALSFLLTLTMIIGLMPGMSMTAYAADPVSYKSATVDATHAVTFSDAQCSEYTIVSSSTQAVTWNAGWYVVNSGTVNIDESITINGDVNIILCDGATLNAKAGIAGSYDSTNSLTVYGQSENTGKLSAKTTEDVKDAIGNVALTVNGGNVEAIATGTMASGFGGNNVTVNGGSVTTEGCQGININNNCSMMVNGGSVTATVSDSDNGAHAINSLGPVVINGGSVTATSSASGSNGINSYATVTISGGTVTASGDMGINTSDDVAISGGTVNVTGGQGNCIYGKNVTISGGTVTAESSGDDAISALQKITFSGSAQVTASTAGESKSAVSSYSSDSNGGVYLSGTIGKTGANASSATAIATDSSGKVTSEIGKYLGITPPPHTHDDITFTPWTSADSLPTEAGSYYLTTDVTLDDWIVPTNAKTHLCLNGKTVTLSDPVTINSEATLNLYDDGEDGKIINAAEESSIGIQVGEEGTFNMHGGTISGFLTGVEVSGSFNMDGGKITGNEFGVDINEGSFTMTGGTITSNMYYGVGVGADDRFNVSGAPSITNNNVDDSDARNVYLESGATITVAGALTNTTPIGVTMETPGTFTSGWSTYMNDTPPANYFISDNGDYEVEAKDNESALTVLYPLWVGGTQVTGSNAADVFGDGKVSFAPATTGENATPAILTLNGASITSEDYYYNAGIYYTGNDDLKIILAGSNSINITDESLYGIDSQFGSVTIEEMTAGACLNISVKSWGISAPKVTISSGTVNVNSESDRAINGVNIEISGGTVTAAGNSGAILGTVKNAIAGTGWTNVEGTEGQASIATSTEGQSLTYKKVQFPAAHTHSFTYSVSGATITATCSAADCPLTESKAALTIAAPTLTIYGQTGDGVSAEATLTGLDDFKTATGLNVQTSSIVYWNAKIQEGVYKTDGDQPLTAAPTSVGNYLAKITVNNCIASVGYTIAKKAPAVSDFTYTAPGFYLTYDGNAKTATVEPKEGVTGMGQVTVKYYSDQSYSNEVSPTNVGIYYVGITVAEGDNYSASSAVLHDASWKFTINRATPIATDFTYNAPSDLTYDGNAKSATVEPKEGIFGMGAVTVKYYSDQRRTNEVTPINVGTYYVGITLSEGNNYYNASSAIYDQDWQFTISKQAAPASLNDDQKPTANTGLTYTGSDKALVTAPTKLPVDYIEMQYALGENATTAPTSGWGTSIPAKTNAGTYYVWYKIVGDSNHNDTEPVCVTVTISKINPTYTIPTGLTATYGQRLADVTLTPGWAWADSTQSVGNVGTNSFKANFTPTDTTNYSAVSNVYVAVTVAKATQTAVPSGITVHEIASDTVWLTGAAGEEYIIAPKGTTTPDWIAAVTADEYNLVTFNELDEATEYTVFARVAETDNYLPGTAVTKDVTTYLSSYGFGGEPLVGGTVSAPVDAEVDQAGISYQRYLDETAIDDATGASYVVQEDDAGETLSVQPFRNGAPLWAEAYEVGEVHYATVNFYKEYKENPDELELIQSVGNLKYGDTVEALAQPAKSGYNFAGWQEGMPGAFEVVTFPMTVEYSADVYAKWTPIYVAPAATTVTVPVSGDAGEENVSVKISGDKAILDLITDAQIANAIGEDGKRITIDLTGMNGSYEFEISKAAGEKIADAVGEDGKALIWLKESSGGTDAFYGIEAPASFSKGSHFWVRHIEPTDSTITDAVRDYYFNNSQHEQWIIDAGMTSDGKEVHDLGGDTVNLYIAVGDDWSADDMRAVFISEDGETENVVCGPETAVNQSGEHRYARLELNHFSTYILRNMKDCPINEFTDADANAWYHDGVHFVLENKLMSGYGDGKFGPADYTSRAMVAQILWNLEGKPASTYEISYSDVAGDAWYADAIRWASENGIVTGYGDGKFGPDDNITREQLAAIIYRYAQSKGQGFTGMWMFNLDYEDAASVSDWASEAMHWMVMKGIIKGQTDKTLAPKSFASRAEIATIIMRYAALEK